MMSYETAKSMKSKEKGKICEVREDKFQNTKGEKAIARIWKMLCELKKYFKKLLCQ